MEGIKLHMKIDDLDFKIIAELKKDSRLSMRELGRKISLSAPSVTERVRRLESFGVIKNIRWTSITKRSVSPFPASLKQR